MGTQNNNAPPALTTGELFAAMLLVTAPTALGQALSIVIQKPNPTLKDWSDEVVNIKDTLDATTAIQAQLADPRLTDLFNSFLQNNSTDGKPLNVANMVRDKVFRFSQDSPSGQTLDWGGAPHPKGATIQALIDHMKKFTDNVEESNEDTD